MEERGKKTAKSTRKRTSRQEKKNDKRNYLGCAFTWFWITAFIFRACVFVQVFVFIFFLGPNSATYQHASLKKKKRDSNNTHFFRFAAFFS